jgi:hypothetical protein
MAERAVRPAQLGDSAPGAPGLWAVSGARHIKPCGERASRVRARRCCLGARTGGFCDRWRSGCIKRPELPIGWLYCGAGLLGLFAGIARVAVHALADAFGSPQGGTAAWLSAAGWYLNIALLVLASLLFPSGRPPSRGWWAVAWVLAAGGALVAVALGLLWPARSIELLDPSPGSSRAPFGTSVMNLAHHAGRSWSRHCCCFTAAAPARSGRRA